MASIRDLVYEIAKYSGLRNTSSYFHKYNIEIQRNTFLVRSEKTVTNEETTAGSGVWGMSALLWVLLVGAGVASGVIYYDAIDRLIYRWSNSEEYGYGFLIPFISAFLIWQKREELDRIPFKGSWIGVLLVLLGLMLFTLGYFSTLFIVMQYGLVVTVVGVALATVGWDAFRKLLVPLLFLVFMIPLPNFLYAGLSSQLQLISSEIGVAVIRLFGISVYLEGNVIDLGTYKLQVVEACSGLRYLFPLVTLAFMVAYFFKAPFWQRAVVFLSSIPITVLMNSFRIGVIGVLVEYGGPGQAEGFLHEFEGWVVFMACIAILIAEMWLFARFGKKRRPLSEVFGLELPAPRPKDIKARRRAVPRQLVAAIVLLLAGVGGSLSLDQRVEIIPDRQAFSEFPVIIGDWRGRPDRLEQIYLDVLKLDDYVIADYVNSKGERVNFYSAYYASQRSGESAHSPRSCIPGGGWLIDQHTVVPLANVSFNARPLKVNRLVIKKDEYTQLVYYWFQQRGRDITNEYMVKWYLFWDALTKNRTDGSLVRLTVMVKPGQDIAEADKLLQGFAAQVEPLLDNYIPE